MTIIIRNMINVIKVMEKLRKDRFRVILGLIVVSFVHFPGRL